MRGARYLLLLAIASIVVVVAASYFTERGRQAREAPLPPEELPLNIDSTSDDWVHTEYDGDKPKVEIRAKRTRQIREPSEFELEDVELRIFDDTSYDLVRCDQARFDIQAGTLYTDRDVEITLSVPLSGAPPERPVVIRTSGARFDTATGRVTTDRKTSFTFDRGEGNSIGATYEPALRNLRLHSQTKLVWRADKPGQSDMEVEAEQVVWNEELSKVFLSPWARFRRGNLTMEGKESEVLLESGEIRQVDSDSASGGSVEGRRKLEYAADHLRLEFAPGGAMRKIVGEGNAVTRSLDDNAETEVTGNRIQMDFREEGAESLLESALAMGQGKLVSRRRTASETGDLTRVLSSEVIKALMGPTGRDITRLETAAPATVEFLPATPDEKRRWLSAERLWVDYAPGNRIRTIKAAVVATRTDNPPNGGTPAPPLVTWSNDFVAEYTPATGELARMEQWGDFRYEEGTRQATADKAVLDPVSNLITLSGAARLWDEKGSTTAQEIVLNQADSVYTATGQVSATRLPGDSEDNRGLMRSGEALQAKAEKMVVTSGGQSIAYRGNAMLWQGANRLLADQIDINRKEGTLDAKGNVRSRLVDSREKETAEGAAAVHTKVSAQELHYEDKNHIAHYMGQVRLLRPGLELEASELMAFFSPQEESNEAEEASSLQRLRAEGNVRIERTETERNWTMTAEHGDYDVAEEIVGLTGGQPKIIDSERGTTEGSELTYYVRDDRLLVDGAETQRAMSRIDR